MARRSILGLRMYYLKGTNYDANGGSRFVDRCNPGFHIFYGGDIRVGFRCRRT